MKIDDSLNLLREFVPGVSVYLGSESFYYHYDRLGSVRFLTDASGSIVQEYVYDAFGNLLSSSGSLNQPYEYVGREGYYREEFGLYLLGVRWYDSEVGRFISRNSPYTFKGNNPTYISLTSFFSPNMGYQYGVEIGIIVSVGIGETRWCDNSCKLHLIEWWKHCIGLYGGISGGGGITTIPPNENPWEVSIPIGLQYPIGVDIGFGEDTFSGSISIGYDVGVRNCWYHIRRDTIIGRCK